MAFTTAIGGNSSTPTLKNLASNGRKIGNEIDNTTSSANRDTLSNWELKVKFASAPTAGYAVELYFVRSGDGTTYAYGDDSNDPPITDYIGSFIVQGNTNSQRICLDDITLPSCKFKPFIYNKAGQAFTNVDDDNILSYITFNISGTGYYVIP